MIRQLAVLAMIDLDVCVQAVEEVVAYYRSDNCSLTEIVEMIACYLIAGEEERAVLHQFREEVARLQEVKG